MRVSTPHRHSVLRSSPALGAWLYGHFFLSLITVPALVVGFAREMGKEEKSHPALVGFVVFFWCLVEPFRLYFGFGSNHYGLVFHAAFFVVVCAIPQALLLLIYLGAFYENNDFEFGICVCQLLGLVVELVLCLRLAYRLAANDSINFFIRLGAVQRQGAAIELAPLIGEGGRKSRSRSPHGFPSRGGGHRRSNAVHFRPVQFANTGFSPSFPPSPHHSPLYSGVEWSELPQGSSPAFVPGSTHSRSMTRETFGDSST